MLQAHIHALQSQGVREVDLPFALWQAGEAPGMLLLHGSAASPCNHRDLAQMLYAAGWHVIAPLLAGHHDLDVLHSGRISWQDCYESALEALSYLQTRTQHIWVLGSSFGGTLAYLLGVDQAQALAGIIAVSAPSRTSPRWQPTEGWMKEVNQAIWAAEQHMDQLERPTLIMHGSDDIHVSSQNAHFAYEKIASSRKKLIFYQGIGHALGFGHNTPEMLQDVLHFIHHTTPPQAVNLCLADQGYQEVALAGDFNQWQPQACQREADGWRPTLKLAPGRYQYKWVCDGQWILDPYADQTPNPHGEVNSLLVLPNTQR